MLDRLERRKDHVHAGEASNRCHDISTASIGKAKIIVDRSLRKAGIEAKERR